MENTYPNAKFAITPTIIATAATSVYAWMDTHHMLFVIVVSIVIGLMTFVYAGFYSALSKVEKSSRPSS